MYTFFKIFVVNRCLCITISVSDSIFVMKTLIKMAHLYVLIHYTISTKIFILYLLHTNRLQYNTFTKYTTYLQLTLHSRITIFKTFFHVIIYMLSYFFYFLKNVMTVS